MVALISSNTTGAAFEIVGFSIAVSVIVYLLVARITRRLRSQEQNGVIALIIGVVGSLYAILIAFVVVQVWDAFSSVKTTSQNEATYISNLLHYSQAFPDRTASVMQARLIAYAKQVAVQEWKTLGKGREEDIGAEADYDLLWKVYRVYTPRTPKERTYYAESLYRLGLLGNARETRLSEAKDLIPSALWIGLIIGAVVTLLLISLFWTRKEWIHVVDVIAFGGLIGFVFFLIYALDSPFVGSVRVHPSPFIEVQSEWARAIHFTGEGTS